jgi:hypothetical protein
MSHRAKALGESFPINFLFSGETYGIAEPENFAYVLDDEPKRLERESIFEVCEVRAPTNFQRLWRACVHHWRQSQPATRANLNYAVQLLDVF